MSREFDLVKDHPDIMGVFWPEGIEDERVNGALKLKAGCSPCLETNNFPTNVREFFPGISNSTFEEKPVLQGSEAMKIWFTPARKVIHGHDEQGKSMTLLNCHSSNSHITLARVAHSYSCLAAIHGVAISSNEFSFNGIRLHFDHQDEWLNLRAFGHYVSTNLDIDGRKRISEITIPFSTSPSVNLELEGYKKSEFYLSCMLTNNRADINLSSCSYLDLTFLEPRNWEESLEEIDVWRCFFSLACRTTVDIAQVSVYKEDVKVPFGSESMAELPVWVARMHTKAVEHPDRRTRDFHFAFSDVESEFSKMITKWQSIQTSWAAVLHRFFATTEPRDLRINETFLFLSQAIESLCRVRKGIPGDLAMTHAAKEAWMNSPSALQELLGSKKTFINQIHKTRNYWTHHGKPGPGDDPDILGENDQLIDLNEKLRLVIESAILQEIGVPEHLVSRVWSKRWRPTAVEFQ